MKPHLFTNFTKALTVISVALGAIALGIKPSDSQSRFACDSDQMATTVITDRGVIPLIQWSDRSFPPPFTPEERCQIVSSRFEKFYNNGTLKYIKADTANNLPVLCVAAYKGGSCLPDGLLVTFKPGTDANQTLLKILDRRVWAASGPIRLKSSPGKVIFQDDDGTTYVDMEAFLNWGTQAQP